MAICLSACQPAPVASAQSTPEPTLAPYQNELLAQGFVELVTNDFLPPVLPANPVQADYGEEPYFLVCMACHGDWGQGLTKEWRERGYGGEFANCWQSQCHGPHHPEHGFTIPKEMPPVLGYGSLARYSNAGELFEVIYETMPWWNPGSLSEEQAWELTAYLMRARGEIYLETNLNTGNAPVYRLHVPAPEVVDERPGVAVLLVTLTIGTIAFVWKKS
jgi:cytochrome c